MNKVLIATSNQGKIKELKRIWRYLKMKKNPKIKLRIFNYILLTWKTSTSTFVS